MKLAIFTPTFSRDFELYNMFLDSVLALPPGAELRQIAASYDSALTDDHRRHIEARGVTAIRRDGECTGWDWEFFMSQMKAITSLDLNGADYLMAGDDDLVIKNWDVLKYVEGSYAGVAGLAQEGPPHPSKLPVPFRGFSGQALFLSAPAIARLRARTPEQWHQQRLDMNDYNLCHACDVATTYAVMDVGYPAVPLPNRCYGGGTYEEVIAHGDDPTLPSIMHLSGVGGPYLYGGQMINGKYGIPQRLRDGGRYPWPQGVSFVRPTEQA